MTFKGGVAALALASGLIAAPVWAEPAAKVAIHVDDDSVRTMNMVLNNAANIEKYYSDLGKEVVIEIVTYGPGLNMLRDDTSPVKDRIAQMALQYDNLVITSYSIHYTKLYEGLERARGGVGRRAEPRVDTARKSRAQRQRPAQPQPDRQAVIVRHVSPELRPARRRACRAAWTRA